MTIEELVRACPRQDAQKLLVTSTTTCGTLTPSSAQP
jgi:hypothetical protein